MRAGLGLDGGTGDGASLMAVFHLNMWNWDVIVTQSWHDGRWDWRMGWGEAMRMRCPGLLLLLAAIVTYKRVYS